MANIIDKIKDIFNQDNDTQNTQTTTKVDNNKSQTKIVSKPARLLTAIFEGLGNATVDTANKQNGTNYQKVNVTNNDIVSKGISKGIQLYNNINPFVNIDIRSNSQKASDIYNQNKKIVSSVASNEQEIGDKLVNKDGTWRDFDKEISKILGEKNVAQMAIENNLQLPSPASYKQLDEYDDQIEELKQLKSAQEALKENQQYDYYKNSGNDDEFSSFEGMLASKNDTFVERRSKGLEKTFGDLATTVAGLFDGARDLLGEGAGRAVANISDSLYKNGTIDEDSFNYLQKKAKSFIDYEANAEDSIGSQMRKDMNQLALEIQYGTGSVEKFIGEGLDSTANFLIQYALLGGTGSLVSMGLQSGTGKYYENLENGYDQKTALMNGALTGLISFGTEKIGMDNFVNTISGGAGEMIAGHAAEYITKSILTQGAAEGLEEVVEGNLDYALDAATAYINGQPIPEYNAGEIFYSFLVGGFSGALMGGVGGSMYAVTTQKSYNALQNDMNSMIEIRDNIKNGKLSATPEQLNNINNNIQMAQVALSKFDAQADNFTRAIKLESDIPEANSNLSQVKKNLTQALKPSVEDALVLNDKINGLENNMAKMSQALLSQKGLNIDAKEYSQLDEQTRKSVDTTQKYANELGAKVGFSTNLVDSEGNIVDGVYHNGTIIINPNSKQGALSTLIHELTHGTESSKYYGALSELARENFGDGVDNALEKLKQRYSNLTELDDEGAMKELTAITTQELLGNEEYVDRLVRYNNSLATRIYEGIKQLVTDTNTAQDIAYNFERAFVNAETRLETRRAMSNGTSLEDINKAPKSMEEINTVIEQLSSGEVNLNSRACKAMIYLNDNADTVPAISKNIIRKQVDAWSKGFETKKEYDDFSNKLISINNLKDFNEFKNNILKENQRAEAEAFNNKDVNYDNLVNKAATLERELANKETQLNKQDMSNFDRTHLEEKPLTKEQILTINQLDNISYKYVDGLIDIYATAKDGDALEINKLSPDKIAEKFGTKIANEIIDNVEAERKVYQNQEETNESIYDDKEYVDSLAKEAEKDYGITYNANEVGYIDINGKWIDFSGRKDGARGGYRAMDHREMTVGGVDWYDFIKMGNIRVFPESGGFEIEKAPNEAQQKSLLKYLQNNTYAREDGSFIGISKSLGNNHIGRYDVANLIYEDGQTPNEIMSDVMSYFKDGNVRFSDGTTLDDLRPSEVSTEYAEHEKSLKTYFRDALGVSLRRNSSLMNELLEQATQEVIDTGVIQEDTYRALYDLAYENTKVKNDAPDYDPSEIRKYLKSNDINFEGLVKDLPKGAREKLYFRNKNSGAFRFSNDVNASGWDQVMQEFNQRYAGLINPEEINSGVDFVYEVQDALAMLDEQKNGYRTPTIESGMSEREYEDYFRNKFDSALDLYSQDIRTISSEDYINQKLAEEYGKANMDQLLQEEQDALDAYYDQASVGNLSQEELDQFERDSIETLTPEQAREKGARVLTDPVVRNKPLRTMKEALYQVRQKIFDKGIAIRDLKNSKLNASYDYYLNSENMANNLILNGRTIGDNKVVKSLTEISKQVPSELKNAFDEYMYHRLNVDAAKVRKNVFFGIEGVQSEQIVNQYELAHPEWKDIAQDYYKYNDYLLAKQVESGVISPDTAAKWKEMYPNYVPIVRETSPVDETNVIETKDPKVQSANKGTLNERTGGNSALVPLDQAMAEHTKKVMRSTTFNNVARDYVQASNSKTTTFMEMYEPDEVVNGNVETLQAADENTPATLIWYDGGDRKIVEIPENIYDAFAPTVTPFKAGDSKILTTINKLRTNMITGANPVFWVTNGVKDAQDIAFNSKYAKDTYMNLPRAFKQIVTHGDIYQSYVANGGEYNTYSSEAGLDQNEHSKFYNKTIGRFVWWNNVIEMTPRLAEYMSSLDHGDSVETAMYNAAEVTTNFKRGGDYAKWLNRNGATFLNASIQGFDKQVRNITDAYDSKGWKGIASYMAKATLMSGIPLVLINGLLHRDDDDYDKLSDYIKDDYYVLFKYDDGKFFRIPKGRIANAWQGILTSFYDNGQELISDDDLIKKAQKMWENTLEGLLNVWEQVGINNPKENNLLAPVMQVANNESWYGEPIVSSFMEKKDAPDQYDESTDLLSVWLGEKLNLSPKKINYVIDQYSGGLGDFALPMLTPKAETGLRDGTAVGDIVGALASPFADKFTTDSVFKNQDVSDFFTLQDELTARASKDNATDDVKLSSKYINAIQYRMNELYAQKRDIYNSSMSDVEKYEAARDVQREIDALAETGINTYDQVDIQDDYGFVNGYAYHRNNENSWSKIDDATLEVMDDLNMTPSQRNEFFNVKDTIKEFKGDTKKAQSYDTIVNSNLSDEQKNYMYDKYYDSKVGDYINTLDISDKDKLDLKYNVSSMTGIKDSNGKSIANSKALAVANEYAKAGVLDDVMNYIQENDLEPSSMGLSKTVYNYTYDQIASAYQSMYGQEFGVRQDGQVGNNDTAAIDKVSTGTTKGSTKSSTKKTSKKKASTSKSGLKLTGNRQLDEKKIIAYIGSLMSGSQSNPYKGVSTVLNKTKSGTNMLSDVKKNVDAIKKKYM